MSFKIFFAACLLVFRALGAPGLTGAQETAVEDFRAMVARINAAHASALVSGRFSGRLVQDFQDFKDDRPLPLVDCDFKVTFDGERFRLERTFHENNLASKKRSGFTDGQEYVKQVFLFRGDENYWMRLDARGNVSCLVLNRQWAQSALQQLDSPGVHPMRLWETPARLLQDNDLVFDVGPLKNDGILARAQLTNYDVACYFLPPEPLRLSRLTVKGGGDFSRAFNLEWAEANGTAYVRRYSENQVFRDGSKLRTSTRMIEYYDVEPNIEVSPEEFELLSLGLAKGTEFRANAPIPTKYMFDGEKLVRLTQ